MDGNIPNPPNVTMFAGTLRHITRALKKDGKELLLGPSDGSIVNDLADVLGRIERAATPVQPRPRRARTSGP